MTSIYLVMIIFAYYIIMTSNKIQSNFMFKDGSKILIIHTGGLQGIEGMNTILRRKNSLIIK